MNRRPPALDTHPAPTAQMLGKWMSAAMVIGTMIGSGIYLLPTTLAPFGPNIIIAFLVTGAGTMCIAFCLARLAGRIPGGPFAYVGEAFGETAAFMTMWSYIVSQWTGIAAVTLAVAGALGHIYPAAASGIGLTAVALGSIAILTVINLRGARSAGAVQVAATAIKIVPLVAVIALVVFRAGTHQPLQPLAPIPLGLAAVTTAAALMLFSLTGFEAAAVTANVTRDATSTVPRATIYGTGFTAIIYLFATLAALMLLPVVGAAMSAVPYADAIAPVLGPVAGGAVALIAAISAFGTANALLLLAGELSRTIAGVGDLPPLFHKTNGVGAPVGGLLVAAFIAALLVLASTSEDFVSVYVFITLVSIVAALVLYVVCVAAALKLGVMGKWTVVAILGLFYSVAMFVGAGLKPTLWGLALAFAGLPIRWLSRRLSSTPAPADGPAAPAE
ncbi:MAG: amino acid permease [Sphingomicrobium sp.]